MQAYHRRRGALTSAIEAGIVGRADETATAMFMDMGILHATVSALKARLPVTKYRPCPVTHGRIPQFRYLPPLMISQRAPFPAGTLHTFAVKSNPVGRVLELLRDAGLGAEVSSFNCHYCPRVRHQRPEQYHLCTYNSTGSSTVTVKNVNRTVVRCAMHALYCQRATAALEPIYLQTANAAVTLG